MSKIYCVFDRVASCVVHSFPAQNEHDAKRFVSQQFSGADAETVDGLDLLLVGSVLDGPEHRYGFYAADDNEQLVAHLSEMMPLPDTLMKRIHEHLKAMASRYEANLKVALESLKGDLETVRKRRPGWFR